MSFHLDALFWFRTNHSLLVIINNVCLAEKYKKNNCIIFDLTRPEIESMNYRTRSEHANHYTTENRSKFNLHFIFIAGVSEKSLMEKPSELQIEKIVSQLTFTQLKFVLIHWGFDNPEIDKIETDNQGNIQNVMFLCLQEWRQKKLDGTLADIEKALAEATVNTHMLCKVSMPTCRLLP